MYWPNDHNEDYFAIYREQDWKLIHRFASDSFELYNLGTDPTESNDVATANPERVMTMARGMARRFDGGWGPLGPLWPTFDGAGRPYVDDPFASPQLPTVDVDADGIADNEEDANGNGLVDPGETSADASDTDRDSTDDGTEVRLGLDPLDPTEAFRTSITPLPAGQFRLVWPSAPGTTFRVLGSSGLSGWTPFGSDVPADTGSETILETTVPGSPDRYFFQIELLPEEN